jgi:diguanylate cyclase (GGDEF)-like protein
MVTSMISPDRATVFITEAPPHQDTAIAEVLQPLGYQVQVHPEASILFELLKQPPDLLIIQVAGASDDSYALGPQIRANPTTARLPIIFVGCFDTPEGPGRAFQAGGNDFIALPLTATDVVARVRQQLTLSPPLKGNLPPSPVGMVAAPPPRPSLLKASLQRLHNSLDLDIVLRTAVGDVREQTQVDRAIIYQLQSNGQGLITHEAVADPRLSILHQQVEDNCFTNEHAVKYWSGRVGQINDTESLTSGSKCYRNLLLSYGIRANLVVPIIHNLIGQRRQLWGLIILHQCNGPRQWQPDEIDLLQELAAHLAIAIQQRRLFEQMRRQARQEMLLNHILDEIRSSLDVQHILTCTVKHLRSALNLDQCGITLLHHNLAKLPPSFTVRVDEPNLTAPVPPLQITAALRRQLSIDHDGNRGESGGAGLPSLTQLKPQPVQSIVQNQHTYRVVAIRANSHIQGILWAYPSSPAPHLVTPPIGSWEYSELCLLEDVAMQLGQALHQAGLYQQLQTANDELRRLAHRDGLTQIANRREFDRYLDQEWQRLQREQGNLALVLADVDYFKGYNDTYGHLAGDDCLRTIGQLLSQVTKRPADLAARYGGEEFALILPNTTRAGAIALVSEVQALLNRLALPNQGSPLYGQITLSFGVTAVVPNPGLSPAVLMQRADHALYAAKGMGRNRYCLWSESLDSGDLPAAARCR